MGKRVTVMIDDDLHEKLRRIQAKKIQETQKNIPFSRVVNESLVKTLKK